MNSNRHIELIISGPGIHEVIKQVTNGSYILGRADDADILFPDEATEVSRRHAEIIILEDRISITDLGSSCGVMVNGQVIYKQDLFHNDTISISHFKIKINIPHLANEVPEEQFALGDALSAEDIDLEKALPALQFATKQIMDEIGKKIIGQEEILRAIWSGILANGHILLIGVPGLAKTYIVNSFSEVLGLQFNRIQFTPDLMPTDIIGSNIIQTGTEGQRHFEFSQGPIFTQLLLADEINRTPPKTQAALLEAMQEHQVTVGNRSLSLPQPFSVIATQNPIEQEGTYPLPEAQKDRFLLCATLDYPKYSDEIEILLQTTNQDHRSMQQVMNAEDILYFRRTVDSVAISRDFAEYAVKLVRATRPGPENELDYIDRYVNYGAGPRAGQAIIRTAKARAAMDGRPAICHQDINDSFLLALRHRIICNYKARSEGYSEDKILQKILVDINK